MTRTDKGKWYTVLEVMEMDTDVIAFCILFVAWLVISFFTHDYAKALLYLVLFIFLIGLVAYRRGGHLYPLRFLPGP